VQHKKKTVGFLPQKRREEGERREEGRGNEERRKEEKRNKRKTAVNSQTKGR